MTCKVLYLLSFDLIETKKYVLITLTLINNKKKVVKQLIPHLDIVQLFLVFAQIIVKINFFLIIIIKFDFAVYEKIRERHGKRKKG
jgi:hypothetical protein